jgi:hypothetical protein
MDNYLVIRSRVGTLALNYGSDHTKCNDDYLTLEMAGAEVIMLGADSLGTLKTTHSGWFLRGPTTERRVT